MTPESRAILGDFEPSRGGVRHRPSGRRITRAGEMEALASFLYERYYIGAVKISDVGSPQTTPRFDPEFAYPSFARSARAHLAGETVPGPACPIVGLDDETALLDVDGTRVRVSRDRLTTRALSVGARCRLPLPRARPRANPGWYSFVGAEGEPEAGALLRLYANVGWRDRFRVARAADRVLSRHGTRYLMKTARDPANPRADAMVFYFDTAISVPVLEALTRTMTPTRRRRPAFTLSIGPGLGLAEQDGATAETESFGQLVSRLHAEAVGALGISAPDTILARRARDVGRRADALYRLEASAFPEIMAWATSLAR